MLPDEGTIFDRSILWCEEHQHYACNPSTFLKVTNLATSMKSIYDKFGTDNDKDMPICPECQVVHLTDALMTAYKLKMAQVNRDR